MSNNPNMRRLNRGNLPFSQQVHMGKSLASQVATGSTVPQVTLSAGSNPVDQKKISILEAQLSSLKVELDKANVVLIQIGPPTTSMEVLLQTVKDQAKMAEMAEDLQSALLQRTVEAETLAKKVKDFEDQLSSVPKILDTSKPPDKVWVTMIQSRTIENGNIVVACTMHTGVESETVSGTILIPQSEVGKLRPPKQQ